MLIAGIRNEHIGFGFSPARECLRGIHVLVEPARHAEQMPWIRAARRRFSPQLRAAIRSFRFFFTGHAESFPLLWDERREDAFAHELRVLRSNVAAYRDAVLIRLSGNRFVTEPELRELRRPRWYRAAAAEFAHRHPTASDMLAQFVASPAQSLRAFCDMLDGFHATVFVPVWAPIAERLSSDIRMRQRLLRDFGTTGLLRTLTPTISAQRSGTDTDLSVGTSDASLRFDASSALMLTPSFFCWPGHEMYLLRTATGLRCTIAYAIPPLTARAIPLRGGAALATRCHALGDPVRLRMMELLNARELSTRELAAFLQLAESAVSRHLQILLRADLVEQRRSSYFVMYAVRRSTVQQLTCALSALE